MTYVYLALAIAAEVAGTTLLKATEEFTKTRTNHIFGYLLPYFFLANDSRSKGAAVRRGVCCLVWFRYCFGCMFWGNYL